ncbi:unnamed protein product [Ectocarpus sp. CCAP 1310/34]|nr:unnamed protein product [Ectocarpus sp. CCAP 1310/34]
MAAEPEHLATPAEMATSSSPSATAGDGQRERGRIGKRGAPQAFARKLAEILATESTATISWNANGSAFQVHDVERFSEDILTKYYRHSKFSSFQRQLNLYSFRKIVKGADAGGYAHPMFRRDRPDDLYHVRRSISGSARYEPAAAAAKATAKRNAAASKAAALKQQATGGQWSPPARVHKSGAAARRVGKLRNKSSPAGSNGSSGGDKPSSYSARLVADHHMAGAATAAAAAAPGSGVGVGIPPSSADTRAASSDAGERSPWTSGESSDSDAAATLPQVGVSAASAERKQQLQQHRKQEARRGGTAAAATDSSGDEASSSEDTDEDCVGRSHEQQQHALEQGGGLAEKQQQQGRRSYSPSRPEAAGECGRDAGGGAQQQRGGGEATAGPGSASPTRKSSPFSFFKKFSFMERQSGSGHNRNMSTSSSVDMTTAGALPSERPASSAGNDGPISSLMVDTSAEARAAASGVSLRGVRPPPVSVTGGGQRIPIDPSTAAGNKALTSSPLTPKSSLEAAAIATAAAAAAASAMPPPPKREQREELGLVEQLTNMVEVFDICDLLRKVSTSGSSRLDKHGAIVKPSGGGGGGGVPHHLRNMSVDTDQGMPQPPLEGEQSPTGLGSLASMELVRDSSKDWDTLMAGSADVSDLGNTMVQSVAEFFSF